MLYDQLAGYSRWSFRCIDEKPNKPVVFLGRNITGESAREIFLSLKGLEEEDGAPRFGFSKSFSKVECRQCPSMYEKLTRCKIDRVGFDNSIILDDLESATGQSIKREGAGNLWSALAKSIDFGESKPVYGWCRVENPLGEIDKLPVDHFFCRIENPPASLSPK